MKQAWLENVKEGDTVIVAGTYNESVNTVSRVTATQVCVGNLRYNREDGWLRGGGTYNRSHLAEATPERLERAQRRRLIARLTSLSASDLEHLATNQMQSIADMLRK